MMRRLLRYPPGYWLLILAALLAGCTSRSEQEAPPPVAASELPKADRLLVDKSERRLSVYAGDKEIRRYQPIYFGDNPQGHKRFEGDERTPEGDYVIDFHNPQSRYHLSLRISYPNERDRFYASQFDRSPGGDIFIHGQPNGWPGAPMAHDWTDGCIALSNSQIEELYDIVADGTPITIQP